MKRVYSGIDDLSHLNIECNGDSFTVTGVNKTASSKVTLKTEEMENIRNLALYQARFFPGTPLQKVFITRFLDRPCEQWWIFTTNFGEQFTVKVYSKDFQSIWEEIYQ